MQVMPGTFRLYARRIEALTGRRADINDPLANLVAGGRHLRDDLDATQGNVRAAAERYFAGPDPRRHGRQSAIYGNAILQHFAQLQASARGSGRARTPKRRGRRSCPGARDGSDTRSSWRIAFHSFVVLYEEPTLRRQIRHGLRDVLSHHPAVGSAARARTVAAVTALSG
jgi:hypothetical protein